MFEHIFFIFLITIFLIINYKIILNDVKNNIIKNKLLLYLALLLPFFILYQFISNEYNFGDIALQSIVSFIIGFGLYLGAIWGAGDSKYFIILSLYLSHIGPLSLLGNLSIVSVILMIVFIIKNICIKNDTDKSVPSLVWRDLKKTYQVSVENIKCPKIENYAKLVNFLNGFLIIFLIVRVSRYLLLEKIITFSQVYSQYLAHIIIASVVILIIIFILIRKAYRKFESSLLKKTETQKQEIQHMKNIIFFCIMLVLMYIYLQKNPVNFYDQMYMFLSIGLAIYISVKIFIYLYKLCFLEMEKQSIPISQLEVGDSIEKTWYQEHLKIHDQKKYPKKISNTEELLGFQNHCKTSKPEIHTVDTMKTFAFAPIVFAGFLLTYIYENTFLIFIFNFIKNTILGTDF